MNMRDAENGRLIWRSSDWDIEEMFGREISGNVSIFIDCEIYVRVCHNIWVIYFNRGNTEGNFAL